jgi:hypothetical protein
MRRLARAATLTLALASVLAAAQLAAADPPDLATSQIGQPATPDLAADQVARASRNLTGVVQVAPPAARPAAPAQIAAPAPRSATPAQITAPAAGRNTRVQAIAGHDRCDPASPEAKSPDCARIPENRAQDFQSATTDATANTVDSSAPSSDLVNGILSSGTGSVVQLPPK